MITLYVSHPYGGKEENAIEASMIAADLQQKFTNIAVISPIHAIRSDYAGTPYDLGLSYTLELLRRSDIIYFSGDWKYSLGCTVEQLQSKYMGIYQTFSVGDIQQALNERVFREDVKRNRLFNCHSVDINYTRDLIEKAKGLLKT